MNIAEIKKHYDSYAYPDLPIVQTALDLMNRVLSQKSDNMALIDQVLSLQDDLDDNRENLQNIEGFFKSQCSLFNSAIKLEQKVKVDADYLLSDTATNDAFLQMRKIITVSTNEKYDYTQIPALTPLTADVNTGFSKLLQGKRAELFAMIDQCVEALTAQAESCETAQQELPAIKASFSKSGIK